MAVEMVKPTKKELILELAQKDPFLKVEEIAASVETTPRYVRTILSEARLSLMALRRSYARTMEQKLGINVTVAHATDRLTEVLLTAGNLVGEEHLRVLRVRCPEVAEILGLPVEEALLKVMRSHTVNGRPFYLTEVITQLNLTVREEMFTHDRPLRQALGLEVPGKTCFPERSFEVVPADELVATALDLRPGTPVIRAGNVIETEGRRVGVEYNYFEAYRVKFILSGNLEYSTRLIEKI